MRLAGRIAAAIEVLEEIFSRHMPAAVALHDWGRAHRFAGSGDRAAIGNLVYDSLRQKNLLSHYMQSETPRALVLSTLARLWGVKVQELDAVLREKFSPGPLDDGERQLLTAPAPTDLADWIAGNYPEWLHAQFRAAFGGDAARQGSSLAERAPVDLRTNILKTNRDDLLGEFARYQAEKGPLSPYSVRIPATTTDRRSANVEMETAHGRGWFEVQDTASQLAAALACARPGERILDLCAGAGGKTLALAADMQNKGTIYAYDKDKRRLRPIFERLARAGVTNTDVIGADETARLAVLDAAMDMVFIDAPCTGTGTWRRKPDAKWRLSQPTLNQRLKDQKQVLQTGAEKVRPGGRLVYATCSVLPCENTDQVNTFLAANPQFSLKPVEEIWRQTLPVPMPASADKKSGTLLLSPADHNVDGFFIATFQRAV